MSKSTLSGRFKTAATKVCAVVKSGSAIVTAKVVRGLATVASFVVIIGAFCSMKIELSIPSTTTI